MELKKEILSLDDIFGICSLDNYHHGMPVPEDSIRILAMCDNLEKYFDGNEISKILSGERRADKEVS